MTALDAACLRRPAWHQVTAAVSSAVSRRPSPSKLAYKKTHELAALPGEISTLEVEQATLAGRMSEPDYYRQSLQFS